MYNLHSLCKVLIQLELVFSSSFWIEDKEPSDSHTVKILLFLMNSSSQETTHCDLAFSPNIHFN